jgi:hypothetical protein
LTVRSFIALAALNTAVFSWANEIGAAMLDEVESRLMQGCDGIGPRGELTYETSTGNVVSRIKLQLNRRGIPVFRYWFGESRVDRQTFKTLTCSETLCPMRQAMLHRWQIHVGLAKPARLIHEPSFARSALATEERIRIGEQNFTAREARFPVDLNCRQKVHEPLRINVAGWDIFGEEGYLAGGWTGHAPLFETLEEVKSWLQCHTKLAENELSET